MKEKTVVSVRPARATEVAAIASLFRDVLAGLPYYNPLAKSSEKRKYTATKLQAKRTTDPFSVLAAVDESRKLLGFCFNHFDDYTVWIDWFGVRGNCRKKGIGGAIIRTLGSTARKRGAHKIWCDTRTTNEPSKRLLKQLGFRKITTIKNHWYRQDFILWEKPA